MPLFVRDELYRLVHEILGVEAGERIFASVSKSILKAEIDRICEKLDGIPAIRVHDLRHSHISLLINEGYNALEIGDRAGSGVNGDHAPVRSYVPRERRRDGRLPPRVQGGPTWRVETTTGSGP